MAGQQPADGRVRCPNKQSGFDYTPCNYGVSGRGFGAQAVRENKRDADIILNRWAGILADHLGAVTAAK